MAADINRIFRERIFLDRLKDQIYFLIILIIALVVFFQFTSDFDLFSIEFFEVLIVGLFIIAAISFQLGINLVYDRYQQYRKGKSMININSLDALQSNVEFLIDQRFYPNKSTGVLETFDKRYKLQNKLDEIEEIQDLHHVKQIQKDGAFIYRVTSSSGTYCRIDQNAIKPLIRFLDIDIGLIPGLNTSQAAEFLILGIRGYYIIINCQMDDQ